MTLWDELTPEECVVMGNAVEEGYLSEVIGDFLGHAEQGGAVWVFGSDPDAIRAMIPRFAGVVLDMIKRDLVEIREPVDGVWDKAPPMDGAEIHEVLADASAWIWSEGEARRMVMLMTTERADALLRGDLSPSSPPSDEPHHADRL